MNRIRHICNGGLQQHFNLCRGQVNSCIVRIERKSCEGVPLDRIDKSLPSNVILEYNGNWSFPSFCHGVLRPFPATLQVIRSAGWLKAGNDLGSTHVANGLVTNRHQLQLRCSA